jgi:hypothetical protein
VLALTLGACAGGPSAVSWTFAPAGPTDQPSADASAFATPSGTLPPFAGRMSHQVELLDGYVSMYMLLENTGDEPLTFINTLYDTEPTKLYNPTVVYPYADGTTALVTRDGRFFPSPAIVEPGQHAVYIMGGRQARGSGTLAEPVANIKFCPTRGMDDVPAVPVNVRDLAWTTVGGVTTVSGTMIETEGSQRASLPTVGVAFFDAAGAFVGAVVADRVGDPLQPHETRPFQIAGPGVAADRIASAEGYAFVP